MVATLLAALILTGLAWWLIKGDYFRVNRITCEQDGFPCSESIRDLFQEAMGANIFLLKPKRSAAAVLLKQPVLAVVTIHKRLPNQLRVTVQSRQPFALLEGSDGEKVLVDKAGVGLPTPPESFTGPRLKVGSLPVIGETTVDPLIIQGLSLIELLQRSYIPFEYIWYADSQSLTTQLANDIIATFSGQKDLSGQVDSLQYILHHSRMEDKAIQGIDLRFQKPIITFTQPKDRAS
jgi:cell division septal protein FtsQ